MRNKYAIQRIDRRGSSNRYASGTKEGFFSYVEGQQPAFSDGIGKAPLPAENTEATRRQHDALKMSSNQNLLTVATTLDKSVNNLKFCASKNLKNTEPLLQEGTHCTKRIRLYKWIKKEINE